MSQAAKPGRSIELSILILAMLVISWLGWLRLQQAVDDWSWMIELGVRPGPIYFAAGGAVWGLVGLAAAAAILLRWQFAPFFTRFAVLVLAAWYWLDRLLFAQSVSSRSNILMAAIVTVLFVLYTLAVFEIPRQKRYFQGDPDEPEQPGN